MTLQRAEKGDKMFTANDKAQVDYQLERAQRDLQPFRTQSDALQALWQEIIAVQIHLEKIKTED